MDGLRFVLYDKASTYRRQLSGVEATADFLPNQIPVASFTVDDDHPAADAMADDGARCGVWFRGVERFRGAIVSTPGEGPEGTLTAHVEGDVRKLWDWLGWQVPGAPLNAQSAEYRVYTGAPETVFKQALAENFARLDVPWTVAPDLGRGGAPVRVEFRMHPLADNLIPVLDAAGLVVVLSYTDEGVTVDVREPDTVAGILTLESGVPDAYKFQRSAPTVTRVVVGGRGEGVEREFVEVIDADREAAWGDIIEGFTDARNTEEGSDIAIDGQQALAEGAPRAGVSTTLVETKRFQYGTTYIEGDLVHVKVGPVDIEQRLSVSVTETAEGGVDVVPHIGELEDSEDVDVQLAQQITRLQRAVRDQGRR
ncbi:MAG: ArV2 [Microbacterium sp.]|jgi:hypothetical protein|nr:ArV2 [Microbacterium sp.]